MSERECATPAAPPRACDLLRDRALRLEVDDALFRAVERWLPGEPGLQGPPATVQGVIAVRGAAAAATPLDADPTLRLGSADALVLDAEHRVALRGSAARCHGNIDLRSLRCELHAPTEPRDVRAVVSDLYSMLTISAALLLGRMRRALVHAGAVVTPAGGGWLLVGDSRAGKSTTCATLILGGWDYLSDDQVVLGGGDAAAEVGIEGWPRAFHLDHGWDSGSPAHDRSVVDPSSIGPGRRVYTAPLAGLLFPRVERDATTTVKPLPRGDALTRLIRQSPWLLADRGSAVTTLDLLRATAAVPAFELTLGLDSYRNPARLLNCLEPLVDGLDGARAARR